MKISRTQAVAPRLAEAKRGGVLTAGALEKSLVAAKAEIGKSNTPVALTYAFVEQYEGLNTDPSVKMDERAASTAKGAFWSLQHSMVRRANELALNELRKVLPSMELKGPLAELDVSSLRLAVDSSGFPTLEVKSRDGATLADEHPIVDALRTLLSSRIELQGAQIGENMN